MNPSRVLRISGMAIVGLYAAILILSTIRESWGLPGPVLIPLAVIAAVGIIFLAWKRPLAAGLVVLSLALLIFLTGAIQAFEIYGANSGGFLVISLILVSPLLLAGVLLLAAHRAMRGKH